MLEDVLVEWQAPGTAVVVLSGEHDLWVGPNRYDGREGMGVGSRAVLCLARARVRAMERGRRFPPPRPGPITMITARGVGVR